MQNLNVTVRRAQAGHLVVTMSVITHAAIHFRSFRPAEGATWADMAREAERMALDRWPGETSYRLYLPLGDCGHVTAGPASPRE